MRDKKVTSKIMSKIRSKDTTAEVVLRKELFARKRRFRKNMKESGN